MQRLIQDASKMKDVQKELGVTVDSSSMSFGNIVNAISVMQSKMGIAGTTAKEASTTIQGSVAAMKSAWQNMLKGIADDKAPFDNLINNLVDSIETAAQNILPRVKVIAEGISTLVLSSMQFIINNFPEIIKTGKDIVGSLAKGIKESMPDIINMALEIGKTLISTLIESLPEILNTGVQAIVQLAQGLAQALPELIPKALEAILTIVEGLLDNIDQLIDAGIQLIMGLADGLMNAMPKLIDKIPVIIDKLINAVVNNLPKLLKAGVDLIIKLAEGIIKGTPQLISKIPQIIGSIIKGFGKGFSQMFDVGKNLVQGLWNGINNAKNWILDKIRGFGESILNGIKSFFGIHSPSTVFRDQIGKFMAEGIGVGFENEMSGVTRQMQNAIPTEFDVNSNLSMQNSKEINIKEAFIEAFKQFKPVVILNGKDIGEFAFEYGNMKYGSYYN